MINKEYWLNRIITDNVGGPVWINKDLFNNLKDGLILLEKDCIGGMVLVKSK